MKILGIVLLCGAAAGIAFADTVTVGGQTTYCAYPFRGC
jgi:hypothetical protein